MQRDFGPKISGRGKERTNRFLISKTPDLLEEMSRLYDTMEIHGMSLGKLSPSALVELEAEHDTVDFDQEKSCRPLIPITVGISVNCMLRVLPS